MPVSVVLSPIVPSVAPGAVATVEVRLRNAGDTVEQFAVAVLGDTTGWAVVEPPVVRLFPGDEGVAVVRFQPPMDYSVPAGSVPFAIRVSPASAPDESVVEEGSLQVTGYTAITVQVSPRNVEGRNGGEQVIAVANQGNQPVDVALAVEDPDEAVAFAIEPHALTVEPGQTASARLRVLSKGRAGKVQTRYGYRVVATPAGGPPQFADASFTQRPRRRVLRFAVPLAVLAGLAVFGVIALRPKVTSTAREFQRIAAQVEDAQKAVEQAEKELAAAKEQAEATGVDLSQLGSVTVPTDAPASTTTARDSSRTTSTTATVAGSSTGAVETTTTVLDDGDGEPASDGTSTVASGTTTGEVAWGTATPYGCKLLTGRRAATSKSSGRSTSTTSSTTTDESG